MNLLVLALAFGISQSDTCTDCVAPSKTPVRTVVSAPVEFVKEHQPVRSMVKSTRTCAKSAVERKPVRKILSAPAKLLRSRKSC